MAQFQNLSDRDPVMVRLAQTVAAKLQGTCGDVSTVLDDIEPTPPGVPEYDASFTHELDRLVFCCPCCEYWFGQIDNAHPGYEGGDWMCKDCAAKADHDMEV